MTRSRRFLSVLVILCGVFAQLAYALPVAAQEFVKVEDGAREQLPATPFVGVAYGFIWIALLLYLWSVARGVARVNGEIADLRRRLDRAGVGGPASEGSARG